MAILGKLIIALVEIYTHIISYYNIRNNREIVTVYCFFGGFQYFILTII